MRFLIVAALLLWWIFATAAVAGFCPMDEGLVLAQGHRLLQRQAPHVDFVTPRPALSALLHLGDRLVPLPLFRASRLVALAEIAAYTTMLAALVFGAGPRKWTLLQAGMWCTALLLNVHGFPLMAWYTIDGILLVALGFALVRRGSPEGWHPSTVWGLLLLGAAPLTKQSFFLAPVLGVVVLFTTAPERPTSDRLRVLLGGLAVTAIPGAVYWLAIVARGGFAAMHQQLLGAHATWGGALIRPLFGGRPGDELLALVALLILVTACDGLVRRGGRAAGTAWWAGLGLRWCGSVALLRPALTSALSWEQPAWGIETWCFVLVICVWRMLVDRAIEGVAIVLLLLGWMTSLSWGYANPDLVIGSIVLAGVWFLWRGALVRPVTPPVALAALTSTVAALLLSMYAFDIARSRPYFDRPATEAVIDLGDVSPALAGIRGNPTTAAFLQDLVTCIGRYPARHVAVIPDNAWIYPALSLANPLPLDWLYPPEYHSDPEVLLPRIRRLAREGDYLVLFQPFPAHTVCRHEGPLPKAEAGFRPVGYGDGLPAAILGALTGREVRCGSVEGRWQPGHGAAAPGSAS